MRQHLLQRRRGADSGRTAIALQYPAEYPAARADGDPGDWPHPFRVDRLEIEATKVLGKDQLRL
jgi:hypothetical protein